MQQPHPSAILPTGIDSAPNLAASSNSLILPAALQPAAPDAIMPPAEQLQPSSKKRRAVPAELREALAAADANVELVLIFDTSGGKKGAFGGFASESRDSTERTIDDIITATIPGIKIEQKRIDNISVYTEPSYFIVLLVSPDDKAKVLGSQLDLRAEGGGDAHLKIKTNGAGGS